MFLKSPFQALQVFIVPYFRKLTTVKVVDWRLYDSAYTERYLGLPEDNPQAYNDSSVVQQVQNLPDEPNRLLLFHGMIDENVITTNMMVLIEKLTRACKVILTHAGKVNYQQLIGELLERVNSNQYHFFSLTT
jgi:hypothetical protein